MAGKNAEPLLDLNTLVQRSQVRIDGQLYELLDPGELGILDHHRMIRLSTTAQECLSKDDPSEEDVKTGAKALDDLCRFVLLAPPEVHDKLGDSRRQQIVGVFTKLQLDAATAEATTAPLAAAPSPAEPGSEAAPEQTAKPDLAPGTAA